MHIRLKCQKLIILAIKVFDILLIMTKKMENSYIYIHTKTKLYYTNIK